MKATFGGAPVYDALEAARWLAAHHLPAPPEFSRANSFLNPLGEAPARGWLLMTRGDVDNLSQNGLISLVFQDDFGKQLTFYNLVFVFSRNLFPGDTDDPDALHLVEVADRRHSCHNPRFSVGLDAQYNVRAPAYSPATTDTDRYYADSLDSGALWTWDTLAEDLWNRLPQLGTYPSLPITPDGTPEDFVFAGVPAWPALCQVLWRVGCAVSYDPTLASGQYIIIQVGEVNAQTDAEVAKAIGAGRLIHDEEFQESDRGNFPFGCRVYFHRRHEQAGSEETVTNTASQWQTQAVHSIDVDGPKADAEPGTYHPLWDDLPALYDAAGTLTNNAALTTRAQERTDDFYRMLDEGGSRLHQTFAGLVDVAPGGQLKGVVFRQDAAGIGTNLPGGWVTELVRHPYRLLRVGDDGKWVVPGAEDSTKLHAPAFGPAWPNYPDTSQAIRIATGTTDAHGHYDAKVLRLDVNLPYDQREDAWGVEMNNAPKVPDGLNWPARLRGYANGRPEYEFLAGAGFASTTTTTTTPCTGFCTFAWSPAAGQWYKVNSSCAGTGCVCDEPQICGSYDCQHTKTKCTRTPNPHIICVDGTTSTPPPPTTTTTTTSCSGPACGNLGSGCLYDCDAGDWAYVSNDCAKLCTGTYLCCCPELDDILANYGPCAPCQTVTAPCSICATTTTTPPPTTTTTTTTCDPGTTTTTDPTPPLCGTCVFLASGGSWAESTNACTGSCGCVQPTAAPCHDGDSASTNCDGPPTTTTPAPGPCGTCTYVSNGGGWDLISSDCTSGCTCQKPTGDAFPPNGVTVDTNCA